MRSLRVSLTITSYETLNGLVSIANTLLVVSSAWAYKLVCTSRAGSRGGQHSLKAYQLPYLF